MHTHRLFGIAVVFAMLTCVKTSRFDCDSCESGTYSDTMGATSNTSCISCTLNATSPAGSGSPDNCSCTSGFTPFGSGLSLTCTFSFTTCPPGEFLENNVCNDCVEGTYKDDDGDHACGPCSGGFPSIMSLGAMSELECNGYNLSSGRIIEFNITTGKELNLNATTVKSVVVDFVNDVSTLVHVYPENFSISTNSDFGVRLFVPNTNTEPLILNDIYTQLQQLIRNDGDDAIILFIDGTISLGTQSPNFQSGDRIFFLDSAIRVINPFSAIAITPTRISPKNYIPSSSTEIVVVIRQVCIGLSCQCQKNFLHYCGTDLRTLT